LTLVRDTTRDGITADEKEDSRVKNVRATTAITCLVADHVGTARTRSGVAKQGTRVNAAVGTRSTAHFTAAVGYKVRGECGRGLTVRSGFRRVLTE